MRRWFGVDIGGSSIKFGMFDEDGALLQKWTVPTDLTEGGRHIIPQAAAQIRQCLERAGLPPAAAAGIGLGIPGPVDAAGHVARCVNLHWADISPAAEMQRFFPQARTAAENDGNVAALGEYWRGAGAGTSCMLMITLGTGVGAGLVLGGRLVTGAHGLAGEIGHVVVRPEETRACSCGNHGCLNQYATISGIISCARTLLETTETPSRLREGAELTAKYVCDCAGAGDALALRCIDACMEPLGKVMTFCSHAFDPEVFVLGGGLAGAGEVLLAPIRRYYAAGFYVTHDMAEIVQARLGNDAGIHGACMLAMQAEGRRFCRAEDDGL